MTCVGLTSLEVNHALSLKCQGLTCQWWAERGSLSVLMDKSLGSSQTRCPWGQQGIGFSLPGEHPPLTQRNSMLFQKAFSFHNMEGLYLLTDGKPDTSCSLILSEVQRLKEERNVKIHTISLNCMGRWATGSWTEQLA